MLVERYGSIEASCDGMCAPVCLLELCSEGFAQHVIADYALPCLCPSSFMDYFDEVFDALDEYLLGDEGLSSRRLGLFKETGILCSFLWVQHESSLPDRDYCDDCNGWGQVWISLHCVFLRIFPLVSDIVRDVSVDILDFGDLWLRWERNELYIVDVHGFVSHRGLGSNRSYLGQDNFDTGCCSQLAGCRSVDWYHLLALRECVLFCE